MAHESFEAAYRKYFGDILDNVSRTTTQEEIKDVYTKWASSYDENNRAAQIAFHKPIAEYLDDAIKQVLRDKPKDEIKIMDAGAGTGNVGVELSKLGYTNLHALDISQEMLHEAKKKNVYKKVFCAALNDQRIPEIDTGEFDVLVCCGTLVKGHAHSDAFVEMIRMVKIDGLLCFNIRGTELDDYQEMMLELEKAGRWSSFSRKRLPFFTADDMPKETLAFMYKVLKNYE